MVRDGILPSNARLEKDEESESDDQTAYSIAGDPTDGALTVLGHKLGLDEDTVVLWAVTESMNFLLILRINIWP